MSASSELIVFPDATYRRTGVCDGCRRPGLEMAQCCTYVLLPSRKLTADERHWLWLHRLDETKVPRGIRVEARCSALASDGRCVLVGTPVRPDLCSRYPELPDLDPGCSYRFERIA